MLCMSDHQNEPNLLLTRGTTSKTGIHTLWIFGGYSYPKSLKWSSQSRSMTDLVRDNRQQMSRQPSLFLTVVRGRLHLLTLSCSLQTPSVHDVHFGWLHSQFRMFCQKRLAGDVRSHVALICDRLSDPMPIFGKRDALYVDQKRSSSQVQLLRLFRANRFTQNVRKDSWW